MHAPWENPNTPCPERGTCSDQVWIQSPKRAAYIEWLVLFRQEIVQIRYSLVHHCEGKISARADQCCSSQSVTSPKLLTIVSRLDVIWITMIMARREPSSAQE